MASESDREHGRPASIRIAELLRQEIGDGLRAPGTRIKQDELAQVHEVSRIPVREALRILEGEGLVTITPNAGAKVAALNLGELEEIYLIREELEPLAMRESVTHLADDNIQALRGAVEVMEGLLEQGDRRSLIELLSVDRDFHLLACSAAPRPRLSRLVKDLLAAAQPYRRAYLLEALTLEARQAAVYEHRLILQACVERDPVMAELSTRLHIRRTREALVSISLQSHQSGERL